MVPSPGETIRYDNQEDLANDIKTHDNPNHDSHVTNEVRADEAQREIEESGQGETE